MGGKAIQILLAVIAFVFGLFMIANVIPVGLDAMESEGATQNFSVVTAPAVTDADCVLTYSSYYTDVSRFSVISSNMIADSPIVMSYTEGSRTVNVDGLDDDNTRILTINYYKDSDNSMFTGLDVFVSLMPFVICIGLVWNVIRSMI